ncbi:hypothetical protein M8J75_007556 [Diaphorina citri]|nr:hypothetical protein M8J75_007556 [Diaphorina citri]
MLAIPASDFIKINHSLILSPDSWAEAFFSGTLACFASFESFDNLVTHSPLQVSRYSQRSLNLGGPHCHVTCCY